MKKLILMAMCFVLVLSLCACGKTETTKTEAQNNQAPPTEGTNTDTLPEEEQQTSSLLAGTYKVPLQEIYVDVPAFNVLEEGYSRVFWDQGIKYIAFTCMYDDTADSLEAAHSKTLEKLFLNIASHHIVNELGAVETKTVTINGIETYRFEGALNSGFNPVYDAYICGYSFIYQGYPCSIVGVLKDEAQPDAEAKLVEELVEAMMNSVRDSR